MQKSPMTTARTARAAKMGKEGVTVSARVGTRTAVCMTLWEKSTAQKDATTQGM